jgi:hypothetical protein
VGRLRLSGLLLPASHTRYPRSEAEAPPSQGARLRHSGAYAARSATP